MPIFDWYTKSCPNFVDDSQFSYQFGLMPNREIDVEFHKLSYQRLTSLVYLSRRILTSVPDFYKIYVRIFYKESGYEPTEAEGAVVKPGRKFTVEILFCFGAALIPIFSCTITEEDKKKAKIFDENLELLEIQYDRIKTGMTTWQELEAAGFKFDDTNIRIIAGAAAVKLIFGDNAFQGVVRSRDQLDEFLEQFNQYKMVIIPHRDVTTKEDRFYFSQKDSSRRGHDIKFVLVFRNDVVVYRDKDLSYFAEAHTRKAFAQGLLDLIGFSGDRAQEFSRLSDNPFEATK